MSAKDFCYSATNRVIAGLGQEVGIQPGVDYRPDGYNSARVMTFYLKGVNPHHLNKIRGMRDQLTMWAGLDDKTSVRVGWRGTTILIEIPKPKEYWKQVTIEFLQQRRLIRRGPIATLGLGLQEEPERIDFQEPAMAHVLISGQTRSGKTNTQKLVAWNLAQNTSPEESQLLVFDVAKRGFKWRDFDGVAHLAHPVITQVPEAEAALAWLVGEIERRAVQGQTEPRLFCIIDELKALTDDSAIAVNHLSRIAAVGGEFGLHLVVATQYPQVKMLGSAELKRNITTRLCGKVDDAASAHNALGISGTGAESLQGYGDFLLKDLEGINRLTVAHIQDQHISGLGRGGYNRLPLADVPETRAIVQPKQTPSQYQRKEATPAQMAQLVHMWGNTTPGIHRVRQVLGGASIERAKRIRKDIALIIYHLQQLAGNDCIDFSQKRLTAPQGD